MLLIVSNIMINTIKQSYKIIKNEIIKTPLELNKRLSNKYNSNIFYKREDLQITRSFKIRGSLNKIKSINNTKELICASAGNHAQGMAYSCNKLGLNGTIYVPTITPQQKINRIKYYGGNLVKIKLHGNNFQECLDHALKIAKIQDKYFIHPFDDDDIINGQATIAYEIYNDIQPDFIVCPIGGGGLISGIGQYSKLINPECKIIGVESKNADSMSLALKNNKPSMITNLNTFVDGASVAKVGDKPFEICKNTIDQIYTISNKRVCHDIINCYQDDGIILEPAGALTLGCLDELKADYDIDGKKIVVILSGGNNDISRYSEIMQLNLEYMGLIHYFVIEFNQNPGQLKFFINNIMDSNIDIIRFEYIKKTNKNFGNVLIGVQLSDSHYIKQLINNLNTKNINYKKIEYDDIYYDLLL
jgi:threonine dehydratase